MELELNLPKHTLLPLLIALASLLLAVVLGIVGKAVTPDGSQVLTWVEWKVLKDKRVYRQEYRQMREDVDALSKLLDQEPDPVRAQLLSEAILELDGLSALDYQRDLLKEAASAVRDWAVGALEKEAAQEKLNRVRLSLESQEVDDGR